ncbi:hypothetical protein LguiB_028361 [Lonicera macranthoides]
MGTFQNLFQHMVPTLSYITQLQIVVVSGARVGPGPKNNSSRSSTCSSLSCLAPLEAALFDVDGTLCDLDPIFSGRRNVCRAWQRKLVTQVRALNWLDSGSTGLGWSICVAVSDLPTPSLELGQVTCAEALVDWSLKWRAMREAGLTEQRTPPSLDSGWITSWCKHGPCSWGRVRKSSEHVGIRAKAYRDTETSKSASNAQRSRGIKKRGTRQRFWLSEVTTLIEPIEDKQNLRPGFLKWNISQLTPLLLNADFNALELREAPEETQGEDPIDAPETRILKHKGKRSTLSKRRSSVHKRIKTEKSKLPDNTNNQAPAYATTPTNENVECKKDKVDKEQTQPNTTPDKSVVVQDMRKPTKKGRRLRLRHSITPTLGDKTDDVIDSCLDYFGPDYTEKSKKEESNNRQVETGPSDVTGEELADTPQETSLSDVHLNDPHIVKNPHAEMTMEEKEQVENHDESIGDEEIVHHTKSYKATPAGTSSPRGKIDEQSELIIQEPTLPSENQIGNELHNTDEDKEPKTPVESDSNGLATYDVTEGMPLQCIGWRPAYNIAYVKRLEFDRANLNSRDLQHSQLVKSYKFQMESSRDYHRSIERTNEVHELRIERLTRELRRERANNERIQQENISLWRRLVSLQIEVALKERELAKTHFENKTTSANDPTIPSFEILSQGFNETYSNGSNTNPQVEFTRSGND